MKYNNERQYILTMNAEQLELLMFALEVANPDKFAPRAEEVAEDLFSQLFCLFHQTLPSGSSLTANLCADVEEPFHK